MGYDNKTFYFQKYFATALFDTNNRQHLRVVVGVEKWVGKLNYRTKLHPIFQKYQQQHKAISEKSELHELASEDKDGYYEEWKQTIEDLIKRLQKAKNIKPLPAVQ